MNTEIMGLPAYPSAHAVLGLHVTSGRHVGIGRPPHLPPRLAFVSSCRLLNSKETSRAAVTFFPAPFQRERMYGTGSSGVGHFGLALGSAAISGTSRRRRRCVTSHCSSLSDDADGDAEVEAEASSDADNNSNYDTEAIGYSSEAVDQLNDEGAEEGEEAEFQYDDEDDDGIEFDESFLEEMELFDDEQEAALDELELAEDMGILEDDEFLMKIDDDLVIKAKRISDTGGDDVDADYRYADFAVGNDSDNSDDAFLAMEELELAGAFDEDGKDYKAIDDEMLLEILGLPDQRVGIDEAIALDEEEEVVFRATDRDLQKAQQFLDDVFEEKSRTNPGTNAGAMKETPEEETVAQFSFQPLESALELGVVPTEAGVGSGALPGDFGFDPFGFSMKDWFKQTQRALLNIVPKKQYEEDEQRRSNGTASEQQDVGYDGGAIPASMRAETFDDMETRPASLIIRDYREAEIRHGRLAMLTAIFWPLQELVDRAFLDSFGHTTFVYGGPTLPFFPLLMTFIMLNLGYLDIFASEIKKKEAGDAFEPGDVFWDPLAILQDAPPSMRRNFQQRELFNGRIAMLAVACFFFEEALTHKPLITGRISQFLFEPAYEIPEIQAFFDSLFGSQGASPVFVEPDGPINPIRVLLEEEADKVVEAELSGGGPSDILNGQSTIEPYSMKYNK